MKPTRLHVEWLILLAASIMGAALLQSSAVTQRIDNQLFDTASPLARPALSDDIVLVAIDDASLGEIGAWPWRRNVHAALIERLNDAGARAIVLDILFLENTNLADDDALELAMRRGDNVLLPHTFTARINSVSGIDPLYPLPELSSASAGVGHVVAEPDPDGIFRRFDLLLKTDRGEFPHVVMRALDVIEPDQSADHSARLALIPFHPAGSLVTHSAKDVLAGNVLPEFFAGKIILIGATAQGMGDRYSVAAGDVGVMTGIETQANLLNALLTDAVIEPVGALWQNLIAAAALTALFLTFWRLPPRLGLYAAAALVAALVFASIGLLAWGRMWLPLAPAVIMIALSYPLWSWRRLSHVSRYLDKEAAQMAGGMIGAMAGGDHQDAAQSQPHQGMEYIARQVARVRGLIGQTQDSLAFVRQVIEAAPDAMIVLDHRGIVQMLNAKADEIFPQWETQDHVSLQELFLFGRANIQRGSGELLTQDGRIFLIARASLDRLGQDDEGRDAPAGEILALREITDLRRLDQERKQMLEFLSHDMRTPQVAIIGLTRKTAAPADMRDGTHDPMLRIRKQAERTLKLADDFVQLARLESPELQLEDSNVSALIEEACDRAYVLAEAKQIRIDQQLPDDPCFADVDASLIARMLDNLIGNAVKYSPQDSRIEVGLNCSGSGRVQIIVSDEGAGLPEARIKNPFARFGAHATDAGPSAGLGLALVKKVVDAHNGSIDVASTPGKGTRFTISFNR